MSTKSALELYPNLFAPKAARPQAQAATTPADMRLVKFLMRQMGLRRPAPAPAAPSRPIAKSPTARPSIPARPSSGSRPLPRAAQR